MNGLDATLLTSVTADPQSMFKPFLLNVPNVGPLKVIHGGIVMASTIGRAGKERIGIITAQEGCDCGCGVPGRAILFTPEPQHARDIARQLLEFADQIEAAAKEQATDLLNKAAGK